MNSTSTYPGLFQRALSAAVVLSATAGPLVDPAPRPTSASDEHTDPVA